MTDPESQHRQIALGFFWVSLFVFVGKLAGAAKEMTIAWRYGVSATVDAYVFVFNLVSWPVAVWFSILTVVLLPLVARLRKDAPEALPRFRAELLGLTLIFGLMLGLLFSLGLPILLSKGWLGLSGPALTAALSMVNGLALLAPLGTLISLFSAWMLAAGHHRNTLFEAIPAFSLLVALLMPPAWLPEPLLWGSVAGFALHAAALGVPFIRRGELPLPRVTQRSPAWRFFWASIGIMALGQTLSSATNLVDQIFAAGLDEGSLSALSYANRILSLILGLGATAVGRATLPVFSKEVAKGSGHAVTALALHWFKWMFMLGLVVMTVSWLLAPFMVRVLFERGAFTPLDTDTVSSLLRYALFQVVFYFPSIVLVAALASQGRHKWIALSGALNLLFKLPVSFIFVRKFGIDGLVLSNVLVYALSAALLLAFVRRPLSVSD
ncbi:murein biosynthesis integral membrane protein MurJ [Variovorax guangxiensis]|uniref:murein biosynthesis integral membrane protein MurJ n=1 Tax=Variovorax guangxiensis TaxID=1775474 RepID=UPI001386AF82|nr:lipid II flippase MurJ [Variovorax guangxiensis]